ncbi:hypothetical protein OE88DRAFT_1729664 [Heliocybe sulcata]|uniref:Uncharacterized protein n=1 Tax=Heliocybe sulcata TaxID=5364 RepID=A0A5C3MJ91_9AGAM|nr:hypothetical protein OE88DRAFT_1729664 [Heliocybe sulcata]
MSKTRVRTATSAPDNEIWNELTSFTLSRAWAFQRRMECEAITILEHPTPEQSSIARKLPETTIHFNSASVPPPPLPAVTEPSSASKGYDEMGLKLEGLLERCRRGLIDMRVTARIPSPNRSPVHVKTPVVHGFRSDSRPSATSFGFATASKRRTAPNRLASPPAITDVPRQTVRR